MKKFRDIPYGDHIGPCQQAGLAAGEWAVVVRTGSVYALPVHAVGTPDELIAAYPECTADIAAVARGEHPPWGAPHLCECRTRYSCGPAHKEETP